MSFFQILNPLEWFAFIGVPCILVTMGWIGVKANEAWLRRERERDLRG
jgi:hypothetical protein